MAAIRFEKVIKRFGDITVVRELDLTIDDGEFFTFVGPSGCGKSTILNMIAGLEKVTEGRLFFDGAEVTGLSPGERDVAMVFQSYALYPHLSAYDNIAFPLRMKKVGKGEIDREVRRIAELLGIGDLLARKPRQLSGGERQRVALGRAIIRRPRVFLMDEPLSSLDARLRVEMRGELKRLHRDLGITTLYVTHDQAEALSLSERVAVLHDGTIEQSGTPHEVYFTPANLFVATFIGSPTMNVIRGRVTGMHPPEIECIGRIFSLPAEYSPAVAEVLLGIRPDDLAVTEREHPGALEAVVSVIEPTGPVNWVEVVCNDVRLMGAAQPDAHLVVGGKAFVAFSPEKVHLFNATTGKRL